MTGDLTLIQTFDYPLHGYWDGGAKRRFEWQIDGPRQYDRRGAYQRVGSWSANQWFYVAAGKTDRLTLSNARRRLAHAAGERGLICSFTYEEV